MALDDAGEPLLVDGDLQVADTPGIVGVPDRGDERYVQTLRDVHLLKGLWPPLPTDGRATMARCDDRDHEQGRRRARPGPYQPPADRRGRPESEDLELARLAAISLREAQRVDIDVRDRLLEQLRAERAREHTAERLELWDRSDANDDRGALGNADA